MPALAQQRTAVDSVLKARADSITRADSVSGELPQSEVPILTEVGMTHRWTRDSLFSSGALTLADFLDRVPGLASLHARFYLAPQVGAYLGDASRVRLFLDGVELEPMDARSFGVTDLTLFPIAALEELVVERGANELRLLMRSWRGPLRLTAQTRADVLTGDNRSNTFRGYLARRAKNGFAVQAMLQQRSTDDRRLGGDGDATTIFTRIGIVKPTWSIDATLLRVRATQQTLSLLNEETYLATGRAIPGYEQVQRDVYLRLGVGNVDRGRWFQLMAVSRNNKEQTPFRARNITDGFAADSADTTSTSMQYVATAGWASPRLRLSITERLRRVDDRTLHQPSARVGIDLGRVSMSAWGERNPFDEVTRADAFVRVQPVSRLALTGAVSYGTTGTLLLPKDSTNVLEPEFLPVAKAARGEVALKIGSLWLQGGVVIRDSAILRSPTLFDRSAPAVLEGRALGATFTIVGPLFKGFSLHMQGTRWDNVGWYRPQTQVRSELTWRYHWTGATKTGGFDLMLAGQAEYRSSAAFPALTSTGGLIVLPTFGGTPLGLRAELTIKDATITAQLRNVLNLPYSTVPGLLMPGALTVYGIRWSFWN